LEALWQLGEGTVYDVIDALPGPERRNYMTISSALRSLEKRGLITHTTQERSYVFRPVPSQDEVRQGLVRSLLARAFDGSMRNLVASLLEAEAATPEELAELKALIAAKEQEQSEEE
jgi:predicted transcriptional regulator